MSNPTTCPRCGHESFTASCPRCYRSKLVDCTRDERDDEADELRGKLKFATDALQRIFDHGATVGCCSVCTDAAEAALNQLSKSASNPQESHGT